MFEYDREEREVVHTTRATDLWPHHDLVEVAARAQDLQSRYIHDEHSSLCSSAKRELSFRYIRERIFECVFYRPCISII